MHPVRCIGTAILCVAACGLATGHAATTGGLTARTLAVVNHNGAATTPAVIGCDNFTGTTGATIASRAATTAALCSNRVWVVHVGTWTIQTNRAASNSTVGAVTTQNITSADASAQAVFTSLNTGSRFGGVVLSHDNASSYLAAVLIDATTDRVELRLISAGSSTVIATSNATFATTNTLRVTREGALITVRLNAAVVLQHTLTAAQLTSLGTGTRAGLFGGSDQVRVDDFVVTAP